MTFKDLLLRRSSVHENPRDSLALPRFSFEDDDRRLVSTERLFRQRQDEELQYDPGYEYANCNLRKKHEIIVCLS
jgi:hypothetical protein